MGFKKGPNASEWPGKKLKINCCARFALALSFRVVHSRALASLARSNKITLGRVVEKVDNAIHRINHYPADSVVCFVNTSPLDSDLSGA